MARNLAFRYHKLIKHEYMKKAFSFIYTGVLSIGAIFAQLPSRVTVFSEDGNPFYLIVNGIKQNDRPLTNIMVTG
jgi:hypothetical protein